MFRFGNNPHKSTLKKYKEEELKKRWNQFQGHEMSPGQFSEDSSDHGKNLNKSVKSSASHDNSGPKNQ